MYIFLNILVAFCCLIFGYLIGGFPTAVVVGKVFFHKDPRDYGSHNAGGTNAGRLFGKKVGFAIIVFDMIKTIAPVWICWAILNYSGLNKAFIDSYGQGMYNIPLYYYLSALGTSIGHCWPIYIHFKGGKAASNFMGIACGTSWVLFLLSFLYFLFLKAKKYVSLTAILIAAVHVTAVWIIFGLSFIPNFDNSILMWGWGFCLLPGMPGAGCGWEFALIVTLMAILVVIRHKDNIKRLKDGTERKIKWMK